MTNEDGRQRIHPQHIDHMKKYADLSTFFVVACHVISIYIL